MTLTLIRALSVITETLACVLPGAGILSPSWNPQRGACGLMTYSRLCCPPAPLFKDCFLNFNSSAQPHSCVWLFLTPWTVAHQAPLSMEFLSRQEYWRGLLFPTPEVSFDSGLEPESLVIPALSGGFFITNPTWEDLNFYLFSLSFLAVVGLCCCARAFFTCWQGLLFVPVPELLIEVSVVAEPRLLIHRLR